MRLYDFVAKDMDGNDVSLSAYEGKVVLVVNTATGCGFTPQYAELQEMYEELAERGLEILDFPCNQFGEQAPGTEEEIHDFCMSRYGVTFPQFAKIDVLGDTALPLFTWLSENTTFQGFEGAMGLMMRGIAKKMDKDYKNNGNVKWNFTKFVIGRDGEIVARFEPTADIAKVREAIVGAL